MKIRLLPLMSGLLFKTFFILLITMVSASQLLFAQLYSHNFTNKNYNSPVKKNDNINSALWTSTGASLYFFNANSNPALALLGHNHTYILTLKLAEEFQAEITSITLKRFSSDAATFQLKINDVNYGSSINSSTDFISVTKTLTVSKLRNTVKISIVVSNSTTQNQNYSAIDDIVINGTISAYDLAAEATPDANGILYVNKDASISGKGTSWNVALKELHHALEAAKTKPAIKQIWVAQGEYQPETTGQSFNLRNGLKVYGGFSGFENAINEREPGENPSTLKGKGSSVVYNANIDNTALLEGFNITGGTGFFASNTSYGGGVYNINSSPVFVNCNISDNTTDVTKATGLGAGMYNENSAPSIVQCIFSKNEAKGTSQTMGGGIYNKNSSPVITNCTITDNKVGGTSTTGNGGAICNTGTSSPVVQNSIIWNNIDTSIPAGISSISQTGSFSGTPSVSYNLIQGGYAGMDHIIDADPQFNDPDQQNYTQKKSSPAINAGNPATDLVLFPHNADDELTDYNGGTRLKNSIIDLGPFEVFPVTTWHVNAASTVENPTGKTWESAFPTLQQALTSAQTDDQIWVAKGTYQPTPGQSFYMIHGVKFYGSLTGNESSIDQRPSPIPRGNVAGATILLGNDNSVIINEDNELTLEDVLDGFTIKGGSATYGGGMYNYNVSPSIMNCTFIENTAEQDGGGYYSDIGTSFFINTQFSSNKAIGGNGGGAYLQGDRAVIVNSVFTKNAASAGEGGGIANSSYSIDLTNCTLSSNTAVLGGAIANFYYDDAAVKNSIIYDNSSGIEDYRGETEVIFSLVQGEGSSEDNYNIDGNTDPQFQNPGGIDGSLRPCSPAINRGSNTLLPEGFPDLNGQPRIFNEQIDMGAYEFQSFPTISDLPGNNQTITLPVYAGITSMSEDCQTPVLFEPAGESPAGGNFKVKTYVATTSTITSGQKVFVKRHIDITPTSGTNGSANVTLFFTKQEFDDYNTAYGTAHSSKLPENLKIVEYHGISATGMPDTYSGEMEIILNVTVSLTDDGNFYKVTFPVTGFSGFYVSGQPEGALPVTIASFDVVKKENTALLTWQTSLEINSAAFEIEHSVNGKIWNNIGSVAASDNSAALIGYSFKHENPENGDNLYRLKMIDNDGTFAYSRIRSVTFDNLLQVALYPNPALNVRTVKLGGVPVGEIDEIKIYNQAGKVVHVSIQPASNDMDISGLQAGTYAVSVIQKNGPVRNTKIIIYR